MLRNFVQSTVFLIVLFACSFAKAEPILDQSYDRPGPVGVALVEGFAYTAQTVTTGLKGRLDAVEISARAFGEFADLPWELEILRVEDGIPTGDVLASEIINLPAASEDGGLLTFFRTNFSNPAIFDVDDVFAIALHLQGVMGGNDTGDSPGLFAGLWDGGDENPYQGGNLFSGSNANSLSLVPENSGFDLNFRTFVTVPLPPTLYFLASGLFGLVVIAKKNRM